MGLIGKKYVVEDKKVTSSFKNGLEGIKNAYIKEFHMLVHFYIAVIVVILGVLLEISYAEWLVCLVLIGGVISLELVNTAIEGVVNMITTNYDPHAKMVKDTSAGAVVVFSVISFFIGLLIFLPKIINLFL